MKAIWYINKKTNSILISKEEKNNITSHNLKENLNKNNTEENFEIVNYQLSIKFNWNLFLFIEWLQQF